MHFVFSYLKVSLRTEREFTTDGQTERQSDKLIDTFD